MIGIGIINFILGINKKCREFTLPTKDKNKLEKYKKLYDDLEEKLIYLNNSLEYLKQFEDIKISNLHKAQIEDINKFYENLAKINEFVGKEL